MSHAVSVPRPEHLYEEDLALWAEEQARLLEERRFSQIDIINLIDEVRSVGASQKSEIRNRLKVLVAHLLKWRFQPGLRGPSWANTIRNQRLKLGEVLSDSPSLRRYPAETLSRIYVSGRMLAAKETGIDFPLFPATCPFTIDEILDDDFLPVGSDLDPYPTRS